MCTVIFDRPIGTRGDIRGWKTRAKVIRPCARRRENKGILHSSTDVLLVSVCSGGGCDVMRDRVNRFLYVCLLIWYTYVQFFVYQHNALHKDVRGFRCFCDFYFEWFQMYGCVFSTFFKIGNALLGILRIHSVILDFSNWLQFVD